MTCKTKQEECKTVITLRLIIYGKVMRRRLYKVPCVPPEWGGNGSWDTSRLFFPPLAEEETIFGSSTLMFSACSWDYFEILSSSFHVLHVHFLVFSHFLSKCYIVYIYIFKYQFEGVLVHFLLLIGKCVGFFQIH